MHGAVIYDSLRTGGGRTGGNNAVIITMTVLYRAIPSDSENVP